MGVQVRPRGSFFGVRDAKPLRTSRALAFSVDPSRPTQQTPPRVPLPLEPEGVEIGAWTDILGCIWKREIVHHEGSGSKPYSIFVGGCKPPNFCLSSLVSLLYLALHALVFLDACARHWLPQPSMACLLTPLGDCSVG